MSASVKGRRLRLLLAFSCGFLVCRWFGTPSSEDLRETDAEALRAFAAPVRVWVRDRLAQLSTQAPETGPWCPRGEVDGRRCVVAGALLDLDGGGLVSGDAPVRGQLGVFVPVGSGS